MPGTLSCAPTRRTPCWPLCREGYPNLVIWAVTGFSYKITTLLIISTVTTSCCASGQRQDYAGGVIAGTKWELPTSSCLITWWWNLSCGRRTRSAPRRSVPIPLQSHARLPAVVIVAQAHGLTRCLLLWDHQPHSTSFNKPCQGGLRHL